MSKTTIEEIDQTARIIAEHVDVVTKLAEKTLVLVQKGQKAVGENIKAMEEIEIKAEESATQIFSLGERSQAIGRVLEMIDDMAEQTKVLAVNATIESARTGEAGKGFAVVAQEIGRLNERVTGATAEIREIITQVQDTTTSAVISTKEERERVKEGVARSQQAGKSLQNILEAAGETSTSAKQISIASHQQKSATQQIVSALKEIVELTRQLKEKVTKFKTEEETVKFLFGGRN